MTSESKRCVWWGLRVLRQSPTFSRAFWAAETELAFDSSSLAPVELATSLGVFGRVD
jgi:hypothetical protein